MEPGQKGRVKKMISSGGMHRRFRDIGLIENTVVECVGKSPAGNPKAFLIRGAVIAIRTEDCCGIIIASEE